MSQTQAPHLRLHRVNFHLKYKTTVKTPALPHRKFLCKPKHYEYWPILRMVTKTTSSVRKWNRLNNVIKDSYLIDNSRKLTMYPIGTHSQRWNQLLPYARQQDCSSLVAVHLNSTWKYCNIFRSTLFPYSRPLKTIESVITRNLSQL